MMNRLNKYRWKWLIIAAGLMLSGCESGDSENLSQMIQASELDIASIEVNPANGTIESGLSYQFVATGIQRDGTHIDITDKVSWESSDTTAATVDSGGVVSTAAGVDNSVTISATLSILTGSTQLILSTAPLESITIDDGGVTPSACRSIQLEAIGRYGGVDRTLIPITDYVTWAVTGGTASIGSDGLLATGTEGVINVEASRTGALPGTLAIDPADDLVAIEIFPDKPTMIPGDTLQFTATGSYSDSSSMNITNNVQWASSNGLVAEFPSGENSGKISAIAVGTTTVTASCSSSSANSTEVTVADLTLSNVSFEVAGNEETQTTLSLSGTNSVQVELVVHYSDGSTSTVTDSATWTVREGSIDIVSVTNSGSDRGLVSGLAVGTGIIDVTYQEQQYVFVVYVTE